MKINIMVFSSNEAIAKKYSGDEIWNAFKIALPRVLLDKNFRYSFKVFSDPTVHKVLIPGSIARSTTQYNKTEGWYVWFFTDELKTVADGLNSPILSLSYSTEENAEAIESWLNHCIYQWFGTHLLEE